MPSVAQVSRTDSGLAASLRVSVARLNRRLRTEPGDPSEARALSAGAVSVLAILNRRGDLTIGQLAQVERVQPPSMTRTVNCLESDGLVERRPHPTDGRQVVIRIAPEGRELLEADRRRRNAWLVQRLRELTPEERSVLRQAAPILDRLSNS